MHRLRHGHRGRRRALLTDDPKRIVERGYDRIAERFAKWQSRISDDTRRAYVDDLLERLPETPDVLELGVGAGLASSQALAGRGHFTGIDLSAEQLRRARERLPGATLLHGDFMDAELPHESFDAVVSFYVLNNLPHDELGPLFGRAWSWLRPGAWFLGSLPSGDNPGWRGEWLGAEMFFAGHTPEENHEAGLEIVRDEFETMREPEGEIRWHWLLARRR